MLQVQTLLLAVSLDLWLHILKGYSPKLDNIQIHGYLWHFSVIVLSLEQDLPFFHIILGHIAPLYVLQVIAPSSSIEVFN